MVLLLACAAQFVVVLDVSVVNVALPSIRSALGFDQSGQQWVANGYALVFAGFPLVGGRLADLCGRRRVFSLGLALFSAASLVGGLAGTAGVLIAARAAQGLGAAVLAPRDPHDPHRDLSRRGASHAGAGAWTAVGVAGGAAGNLIGGALTQYLSWRWVLLGNVPIGVAAIVLALRFLAVGEPEPGRRPDVPGAVVATADWSRSPAASRSARSAAGGIRWCWWCWPSESSVWRASP